MNNIIIIVDHRRSIHFSIRNKFQPTHFRWHTFNGMEVAWHFDNHNNGSIISMVFYKSDDIEYSFYVDKNKNLYFDQFVKMRSMKNNHFKNSYNNYMERVYG